jgi:hypothetical protein
MCVANSISAFPRHRFLKLLSVERCSSGLTLVHFSAQPEPSLTPNTPQPPNNTPSHLPSTTYTTPTSDPYPIESAYVESESGRV